MAKNCIATAFNPAHCGVVLKEGRSLLKYYLPLGSITLTEQRESLERAVQVFNLQSMHHLDLIISANQENDSEMIHSCSRSSFKNRVKLFPFEKDRKDSLSSLTKSKPSHSRKKEEQFRKLSTLSKQFSEISEMHKKQRTPTTRAGGSFNTMNSLVSMRSNPTRPHPDKQPQLKRCMSQIGTLADVSSAVERSRQALVNLRGLS